MAETIVLATQSRQGSGSREAQRLRKNGLVPAVVYGHKEATESIAISSGEMVNAMRHHTRTLELARSNCRPTARNNRC
jgi:large subunit ribosomal protein L25